MRTCFQTRRVQRTAGTRVAAVCTALLFAPSHFRHLSAVSPSSFIRSKPRKVKWKVVSRVCSYRVRGKLHAGTNLIDCTGNVCALKLAAQFSARIPTFGSNAFRGIPQVFKTHTEMIPLNRPRPLSATPIPIHRTSTVLWLHAPFCLTSRNPTMFRSCSRPHTGLCLALDRHD
jgi:hypothetical protein